MRKAAEDSLAVLFQRCYKIKRIGQDKRSDEIREEESTRFTVITATDALRHFPPAAATAAAQCSITFLTSSI